MNPTKLSIAVAVLAVLGGAIYYTEQNPPKGEFEKDKILDIKKEEIAELTVTRPEKDPLTVKRIDEEKWEFGGGLTVPADSSAIDMMVGNAASMTADSTVEGPIEDWKPYGLDADFPVKLDIKMKDGKTHELMFGSETPTGSNLYVRLGGDDRLFTTYSYVKSNFEKEPFDLRDKKLLKTEEDKISRVTLTTPSQSIEFGKSGSDAWQILKPAPLRADNFTVGDLVRAARNAEMTKVIAEGSDAAPTASFDKPQAIVEIVDEAGTHTLTVAKQADGVYYAKSSDLTGVYEVSSTLAESLDKPLDDFRNKKLFDFGFSDPEKLDVRGWDKHAVVVKKDDKWLLDSDGGRELDSSKVQTLIDSLRGLASTAFTSDSAADKAKYGLSNPTIEAEVTRAEGKGVEKIAIGDPAAERVYAARDGMPSTYEVEKSAVEEIQRSLEAVVAKPEQPAPGAAEKKEAAPNPGN